MAPGRLSPMVWDTVAQPGPTGAAFLICGALCSAGMTLTESSSVQLRGSCLLSPLTGKETLAAWMVSLEKTEEGWFFSPPLAGKHLCCTGAAAAALRIE